MKCDEPNDFLYRFEGTMGFGGIKKQVIDFNYSHFMLRGSTLENTEWVYGMVIYTGKDSKIAQNSTKTSMKTSSLEKMLNYLVLLTFFMQNALCALAAYLDLKAWDENQKG